MDENFNYQLFECSFLILSLLLKKYKEKAIDITDFKIHTTNKISYILNNLGYVKDSSRKKEIEILINECISINNSL